MKKLICSTLLLLSFLFSHATDVIFDGSSLSAYNNQEVTFTQTLCVCGRYNNYLYLSYERLRQPEEMAIAGTALFDSLSAQCQNGILTAYCPNLSTDTIRLGAVVTNLTATVTGSRNIRINSSALALGNNQRPTLPPSVGNATLKICAANLEYYCPAWSGTLGAESDAQFAVQHLKTIKALANIDADIYAVTEIQQGSIALDSLVNGLNRTTAPGRYAYVTDYNYETSTYTKVGFVYRTDKVRPVFSLGHPYGPGATVYQCVYYLREYVQAFEEISSNERFVLCMNHFKSKSGGDDSNGYYNADRVENATLLADFLEAESENDFYDDADILIVGDLNCGTMEEPIRYLETRGYENQLTRFAPNEYSYVFDNEVEYLDHVLASPTMSAQITTAQPYHINADESYNFYYPYGDTTMYRYSDHDPIIIGLRLSSEPDTECEDVEMTESFATTFGCFSTFDAMGDNYWYTNDSYECAYINGYYSGNNDDWLISPTFDLTDKEDAVISFTHTMGYGSSPTWAQRCKLLISTDYQGDVQNATWSQIAIPNMPNSNWTWCTNTIPVPSQYAAEPSVTFAFRYQVQTGDIPAWEIKNFTISSHCVEVPDTVGIADHTAEMDFKAYGTNGRLVFSSNEPADVMIADMLGRVIAFKQNITNYEMELPRGLYVVRTDKGVRKVVVGGN